MSHLVQHNKKGYTLVEALVSIFILSFILIGVYGVLLTGNSVTNSDNVLLELQQQARNAMTRIVKDVRASSSQTITVISANSDKITFTTPTKANAQYYLTGTNLMYAGGAGASIVSINIARLKFTLSSQLLKIDLRADKTIYGKTFSYYLTQEVRLRNE